MAGLTHAGRGVLFGTPGLRTPTIRNARVAANAHHAANAIMSGSQLPTRVAGDHLFAFFYDATSHADAGQALAGWSKVEFFDNGPAVAGVYHRVATNDASDDFVYPRVAPLTGEPARVAVIYMISVPPFGASTFTYTDSLANQQPSTSTSTLTSSVQAVTAPASGYDLIVLLSIFESFTTLGHFYAPDPTDPPGAFTLVAGSVDRDSYLTGEQSDNVGVAYIRAVSAGALGITSSSVAGPGVAGGTLQIATYRIVMTP